MRRASGSAKAMPMSSIAGTSKASVPARFICRDP
jgi:hypothetical protein